MRSAAIKCGLLSASGWGAKCVLPRRNYPESKAYRRKEEQAGEEEREREHKLIHMLRLVICAGNAIIQNNFKAKCFCMTTKSGSHNRIWAPLPPLPPLPQSDSE